MRQIAWDDLTREEMDMRSIIAMEQHWMTGGEFRYVKKPRPDNGLTLILGEGTVYTQHGRELRADPGDLLYLPAQSYYTVNFYQDHCTALLINFILVDQDGQQLRLGEDISVIRKNAAPVLQESFSEAIKVYRNVVNNKLQLKQRLGDIFLELLESSKRCTDSPIHAALAYINTHLAEPMDVPHLARKYATSESSFRRAFKKQTGMSYVRYINCEKIKKACHILQHESTNISEISELLGFFDESHFCKTFREFTGVSPSQYRRTVLTSAQSSQTYTP